MSIQELKCQISTFIEKTYQCIFEGKLSVDIDGSEYKLGIYIGKNYIPIYIVGNFANEDDFLDYVYKEIKDRRLYVTKSYTLTKYEKLD